MERNYTPEAGLGTGNKSANPHSPRWHLLIVDNVGQGRLDHTLQDQKLGKVDDFTLSFRYIDYDGVTESD